MISLVLVEMSDLCKKILSHQSYLQYGNKGSLCHSKCLSYADWHGRSKSHYSIAVKLCGVAQLYRVSKEGNFEGTAPCFHVTFGKVDTSLKEMVRLITLCANV